MTLVQTILNLSRQGETMNNMTPVFRSMGYTDVEISEAYDEVGQMCDTAVNGGIARFIVD